MKFTTIALVASAASLTQVAAWDMGSCYKSSGSLTKKGSDTFQSQGLCEKVAHENNDAKVIALSGDACWYGNSLPSSDDKVDDSKCDTTCQGYPSDNCGGSGYWRVYSNGVSDTSGNNGGSNSEDSSPSSSAAPAPSTNAVTVVTSAGAVQTVVVTQANPSQAGATIQVTATHTSAPSGDNGPNKGAIAAGVVVGVVGVAAIAGAIFFWMRSRKHREEAAELQRQNSIAGLRSEKPPSTYSLPDSRLEPAYMRRMSDGSIADNQDYSRRILKVTNPDDR